jgi:hypothetical protein
VEPIRGTVQVKRLTAATLVLCAVPILSGCARASLAHTCSVTDKAFIQTTSLNIDMLGQWSQDLADGQALPSEVIAQTRAAALRVGDTAPTDPSLAQARQIVRAMLSEYSRALSAHVHHRDAGAHMMRAYGLANFGHDVLAQAQPALASKGCDLSPLL